MASRTVAIFWAAVAAALFLLGGTVASLRSLSAGGGVPAAMLTGVSAAGLSGALLVAGRIAYVVGRARRRPER